MPLLTASTVIKKQPSETLKVSMDFAAWLNTGVTLSSPIVTSSSYGCPTSDLVITSVFVVAQTVEMTISGGTDGNRYRVEVVVNTSEGEVLEGDGIMEVTDR